jgi:hypothetical protein
VKKLRKDLQAAVTKRVLRKAKQPSKGSSNPLSTKAGLDPSSSSLWDQKGVMMPHVQEAIKPPSSLNPEVVEKLPEGIPLTSILNRHLLLVRPTYQPASKAQMSRLLDFTFDLYLHFMREAHKDEIQKSKEARSFFHLSSPHAWFPFARAIHRKIIYHAGPTNSGKTHHAIEALKAATSGVYCSPLRLLALEQYDRLNQSGILCNLLTGEEKKEVPGAQHSSCTVEMTSLLRRYDVAVIDEIQMIGDLDRGSAWTRALLGVAASEVHLCGDGSALALVRSMCCDTGEELEVREYQRTTPLAVEPQPLRSLEDVKEGDW